MKVIRQFWLESEKGWGTRPDGYSIHLTDEHRKQYIDDYWKSMPDQVPNEYSRPTGDPDDIIVDEDTVQELVTALKSGVHGLRRY